MFVFWEPVVKPLLECLSPSAVVEVGTWNGETTRKLLQFAAERDCVVHTIDPHPGKSFEFEDLHDRYGNRLVFHRATSIAALPEIERIDAALLDGDHNWYTVYNELRLLAAHADREESEFPLTLLHDIDWPYGRRDCYYDPESIPEEHRQAFERRGMVPGQVPLSESGGVNAGGKNAVAEGTPRNGVRTAVEDFLADTKLELRFKDVPGLHGLGIIVAESQLAANTELAAELRRFSSPEWLTDHCRWIEKARLLNWTQSVTDRLKLREAERELREMRAPRAPA
jgi:hypothetical protein